MRPARSRCAGRGLLRNTTLSSGSTVKVTAVLGSRRSRRRSRVRTRCRDGRRRRVTSASTRNGPRRTSRVSGISVQVVWRRARTRRACRTCRSCSTTAGSVSVAVPVGRKTVEKFHVGSSVSSAAGLIHSVRASGGILNWPRWPARKPTRSPRTNARRTVDAETPARRAAASTEIDRDTPGTDSEGTSRTSLTLLRVRSSFPRRRVASKPVPQPLPRHRRLTELEADTAKINVIVGEADRLETSLAAGATSGGDGRRLRGIPAVGRRTSGAVFGTDPVRAMLAKEGGRTSRYLLGGGQGPDQSLPPQEERWGHR